MPKIKAELGFGYQRKYIKKERKLPLLCPDYEPEEMTDCCSKAKFCKNATYNRKNETDGICYGGTKERERKHRKRYLEVL